MDTVLMCLVNFIYNKMFNSNFNCFVSSPVWRPVEAHFQISEDQIVTMRSLKASEFYRRQFALHQVFTIEKLI